MKDRGVFVRQALFFGGVLLVSLGCACLRSPSVTPALAPGVIVEGASSPLSAPDVTNIGPIGIATAYVSNSVDSDISVVSAQFFRIRR